jgi:hypothetical protein
MLVLKLLEIPLINSPVSLSLFPFYFVSSPDSSRISFCEEDSLMNLIEGANDFFFFCRVLGSFLKLDQLALNEESLLFPPAHEKSLTEYTRLA